jgi:hypothetical protein
MLGAFRAESAALWQREGTLRIKCHDRAIVEALFSLYQIEIVFDCEWHNNDFNWFNIIVNPPK